MRLWSIHPGYLDRQGLLALWREGLLAQKVLSGQTRGYRLHPQLERFKQNKHPVRAIKAYLYYVLQEAKLRGYNFNAAKIGTVKYRAVLRVTSAQIDFEFRHLLNKLRKRDPLRYRLLRKARRIKIHPLFKIHKGKIEPWEKIS